MAKTKKPKRLDKKGAKGKSPSPAKKAAPKPAGKKPAAKAGKQPAGKKPAVGAGIGIGSESAYQAYRAAAQALPAAEVRPFRLDVDLAAHNVQGAIAVLRPQKSALETALPRLPWAELWDLPQLAAALQFAAVQVDRSAEPAATAVERNRLLAALRPLRSQLLLAAESLAASGLIPARPVEKIRQGHGSIDQAKDAIELASLFAKHESAFLKNSPIRREHAKQAADAASTVLRLFTPQGAHRHAPSADAKAQIDVRDRLASLLLLRFSDLRAAGYYLFRDALDDHVPGLQSRIVAKKKPTPPIDPAPVPPG